MWVITVIKRTYIRIEGMELPNNLQQKTTMYGYILTLQSLVKDFKCITMRCFSKQ